MPHLEEQLDGGPLVQVGKPKARILAEGAVLVHELEDGQLHLLVIQEEELQQPLEAGRFNIKDEAVVFGVGRQMCQRIDCSQDKEAVVIVQHHCKV